MTDSCEQREAENEEEAITLGSDTRTVRKLTGETPDVQSVRDVTEAVTEERWMEEIPLETREQVLRCPSMERCELTGMSGKCTERVWHQEATNEPPQDHVSDQEELDNEENLLEASQRANRLEFIREFQEILNKAIEQLLNKSVRKHTCWKNKPELNMEQEKHRRTIHKEADMPLLRCNNFTLSLIFLQFTKRTWTRCIINGVL